LFGNNNKFIVLLPENSLTTSYNNFATITPPNNISWLRSWWALRNTRISF